MNINTLFVMLYGDMKLTKYQQQEILKALDKRVYFGERNERARGKARH